MDVDRELIAQVGISVAVVTLFIVGLALLTDAHGFTEPVENETLEGTIEGDFDGEITDGTVTGEFDGTYENDIEVTLRGDVEGTLTDGTVTADFEGTISGAIDGDARGTITDGTYDEDDGTLSGDFEGSADGDTGMDLEETGGLILIGLIAAFIVVMSAAGYVIERFKDEEE